VGWWGREHCTARTIASLLKGEDLKHKVGAHATTLCPIEGALLKLLLIALRGIDAGGGSSAGKHGRAKSDREIHCDVLLLQGHTLTFAQRRLISIYNFLCILQNAKAASTDIARLGAIHVCVLLASWASGERACLIGCLDITWSSSVVTRGAFVYIWTDDGPGAALRNVAKPQRFKSQSICHIFAYIFASLLSMRCRPCIGAVKAVAQPAKAATRRSTGES
jgi:hypothetical protein